MSRFGHGLGVMGMPVCRTMAGCANAGALKGLGMEMEVVVWLLVGVPE
jgi:hypothetical protein